jgi:hypothetical protein
MCLPGGKMVVSAELRILRSPQYLAEGSDGPSSRPLHQVYTGLLSFFADLYEEDKLSVHPVHALDVVLAHEMSHAICRWADG